MAEVEVKGIAEIGRRLRALPPALGSKGGGPLRYALFQAAKVLRGEAILRAPEEFGDLKKNIVAKRHRNPKAVGATERYDIGMKGGTRQNKRGRGGALKAAGAVWYGRLQETGTSKMRAQPFLRPALSAKGMAALDTFRRTFLLAVEKAEAKLARMS